MTTARNRAAFSESPPQLIPYLSTKEGHFQTSHWVKHFFPFILLTWYFVCWWFTLVTVGHVYLLNSDWTRYRWKQLGFITNIQRLTEEDSIIWFDLCGWQLTKDWDNNNGSSDEIMTHVVTGHWRYRNETVTPSRNGAACS